MINTQADAVAHFCIWKAEAGELIQLKGWPDLHSLL